MTDIFLSYAQEDRDRVKKLAQALEGQGWTVFWDPIIRAGDTWRGTIMEAVEGARCVMVAWSRHSIESHWVCEEAEEGRERKILVPVLLDNVKPPMGFRSIQAASLVNWDGHPRSDAFREVVYSVAHIIGSLKTSPEPPRVRMPESTAKPKSPARPGPATNGRHLLLGVTLCVALAVIAGWAVIELNRNHEEAVDTQRQADEKAEEEAKRKAQEQAKAEEEARVKALAVQKRQAEEKAKAEAQIKYQALEKAKAEVKAKGQRAEAAKQFSVLSSEPKAQPTPSESPKTQQQAGESFRDCEGCPEMVRLPQLGIAIGKYEITQGQWREVMGSNPSKFKKCGDDCPVERVGPDDIKKFIERLNQRTRRRYRLPTEEEWYAACQAGEHHEFCGADAEDLNAVAWYEANANWHTHPVGKKRPNAWGLFDMTGNVREWTSTLSCFEFCNVPVVRGGSWYDPPQELGRYWRDDAGHGHGFRLAQDL